MSEWLFDLVVRDIVLKFITTTIYFLQQTRHVLEIKVFTAILNKIKLVAWLVILKDVDKKN